MKFNKNILWTIKILLLKNSSIKSGNIANYKMVTLLQWQSKTQKLLILRFVKWLHEIISLSKQRMRVTMISTLHLLYSLTQFFKAHWLCILQVLTCMCIPNRNTGKQFCKTLMTVYHILNHLLHELFYCLTLKNYNKEINKTPCFGDRICEICIRENWFRKVTTVTMSTHFPSL